VFVKTNAAPSAGLSQHSPTLHSFPVAAGLLPSARGKESADILNLRLHALRRGAARHTAQRNAVFQ